MHEERTTKEYEAIDVHADGCLVIVAIRIGQSTAGLIGITHTVFSYLEHGFNIETLISAGLTIATIYLLETIINKDKVESKAMMSDPGVVED